MAIADDIALVNTKVTQLESSVNDFVDTAADLVGSVHKVLQGYTALRAYTGVIKYIRLTQSGIQGFFTRDDTDTTSVDNGGTIIVATNGKRYKRDYTGTVALKWFDADSLTADQIFTKAFTLGGVGYQLSPGKTYTLTSTITIPTFATLDNPGKAMINFSNNAAFLPSSYNTLNNLRFTGPVGSHAFRAIGAVNFVTIENAVCSTCCLVVSNPDVTYDTMDWVGKSNITQHWSIVNAQGENTYTEGVDNGAFIVFLYANDIKIKGGRAKGYEFGLMYWGGDSNFSRQGLAENVRKLDNLYVEGYTADDCHGAGLWGSMGQNVTFVGCNAFRATPGGDVGIDHEGTVNAINIGCNASNYGNGNYASFFGTKRMTMIDCNSWQKAGKAHFRNYNDSADGQYGGDILIQGGKWVNVDGPAASGGLSTFDDLNGPFQSFTMSGALLVDSCIKFDANQLGPVDIEANFQITAGVGLVPLLIKLQSNSNGLPVHRVAKCNVSYNSYLTSFNAGATFLNMISTASNNLFAGRIHDNHAGTLDIVMTEAGGNGGLSGVFHVYGNTAAAIKRVNAGARPMVIARSDNNYDIYGSPLTVVAG